MARRLVKIAKELNVGTKTIVEHLHDSGFEIKDRPTAKITDEMYQELLREFEDAISVKRRADEIDIGAARNKKTQEKKSNKESRNKSSKDASSSMPKDKSKPKDVESTEKSSDNKEDSSTKQAKEDKLPPKKEEDLAKEKTDTSSTQEPSEEKSTEEQKSSVTDKNKEKASDTEDKKERRGLKVVGKIDLEKKKEKKGKKKESDTQEAKQSEEKTSPTEESSSTTEPEKPKEEERKTEKQVEAESKKEKPAAEKEEKKESAEDDTIKRVSKPKLKGLKIMGKIDKDKLKSRLKKKKSSKDKKKRKRKRKTIRTKKKVHRKKGRRRGQEQQEVTQKEIEEKIRATKARIAGTSNKKSKRKSRKQRKKEELKEKQLRQEQEQIQETKVLEVTEFVSVSELASLMDVQPTDVIMKCMDLGTIVSINQRLDAEIIELVASEYDYDVEFISAEEQTEEDNWVDDPEDLEPRAPIITVMGHVDHGKTSLLDFIREASVATGEAGGITQHIGAYEVAVGNDNEFKTITFLDTPGHEAFTAMRARGAKITDVVVIIIAADDQIMPQTKEAISHAEAAGVPIVFAINKIDKANADPDRIINELAQMNYLVEEWGGKYQSQRISAKTGEGIDELLEKITLEAEMLELEANPNRPAIGAVLEASLDKGRGYVAKLLVQEGTLRIGDPIVAGQHAGKVKAMFNEVGQRVEEVGPSQPTLILGLSGAPQAGEKFKVMESEQAARSLANSREQIIREQTNRATKRISLDEIGRRLALGDFKELNLIVKGDVDGTVEALSDSLIKQSVENIQVNVIHKGVGQIIESDVLLASASDAIIIGFQVRPSLGARKLAEKEGIQIKTYSVIYEAIEEVRAAMEGMLEPKEEEKIVGEVKVREVYKISKVGTVAGCYVQEGYVSRNTFIRVIREGIVIYPKKEGVIGEIRSLKRFKDDVKKVTSGMECGISVENYNDLKVDDIIEAYEIIEVEQTL